MNDNDSPPVFANLININATPPTTPPCKHPPSKYTESACSFCRNTKTYCRKCTSSKEIYTCPICKRYSEDDYEIEVKKRNKEFVMATLGMITCVMAVLGLVGFVHSIRLLFDQGNIRAQLKNIVADVDMLKSRDSAIFGGNPIPVLFDGQCNSLLAVDVLCLSFRDADDTTIFALIARADEDRVLRAAEKWTLGQRMQRHGHAVLEWGGGEWDKVDVVFARPRASVAI